MTSHERGSPVKDPATTRPTTDRSAGYSGTTLGPRGFMVAVLVALFTEGCNASRATSLLDVSSRMGTMPASGTGSPDRTGSAFLSIRSGKSSNRRVLALPDTPVTFDDIRSLRFQFVDAATGICKQEVVTDRVRSSGYTFSHLAAPAELRVVLTAYDGPSGTGTVLNAGRIPAISDKFTIYNQKLTKIGMSLDLSDGYGPNGDIGLEIDINDGEKLDLPPVVPVNDPNIPDISGHLKILSVQKGVNGLFFNKRAWTCADLQNTSVEFEFFCRIIAEFYQNGIHVETYSELLSIKPGQYMKTGIIKSKKRSNDVIVKIDVI